MTILTAEVDSRDSRVPDSSHIVKFYESEDGLFSLVGEYLAQGAQAGHSLVVIARPSRHDALGSALRARGGSSDRLTLLDARDTLSSFMSGSMPDRQRFRNGVGALVAHEIQRNGERNERRRRPRLDLCGQAPSRTGTM